MIRSRALVARAAVSAAALLAGAGTGCRKDVAARVNAVSGGGFAPPPGGTAGGPDAAALTDLYAVATTRAPAAIRPDPDLFVRRLIRQYRPEGPLVAREIGRVEEYRMLLGGASETFSAPPQESYDATSLLAMQKVTEETCKALVAPTDWQHPGWRSILPKALSDVKGNLRFLAQRLLGLPSARVPSVVIDDLATITNAAREDGTLTHASYVPACVALSTDAEALLL